MFWLIFRSELLAYRLNLGQGIIASFLLNDIHSLHKCARQLSHTGTTIFDYTSVTALVTTAVASRKNVRMQNAAKSRFAERMRHCIVSSNVAYRDYSRLNNRDLNRCKLSILLPFNQYEVLSSANKPDLFACKISSNYTFDSSWISLPNFLQ